ncbi:IS256 family transposase, partial [Sediminibacterium sp. WSJ-3]|nr:IS256 family transposase [Sediminibacterium soli]
MENNNPGSLDYEAMKQKLKEQFRTGKSLFSKGGAFAPLLEELLNS